MFCWESAQEKHITCQTEQADVIVSCQFLFILLEHQWLPAECAQQVCIEPLYPSPDHETNCFWSGKILHATAEQTLQQPDSRSGSEFHSLQRGLITASVDNPKSSSRQTQGGGLDRLVQSWWRGGDTLTARPRNMRLFDAAGVQSRVVAWLTESVSTRRSLRLTLDTRMCSSCMPRQVPWICRGTEKSNKRGWICNEHSQEQCFHFHCQET